MRYAILSDIHGNDEALRAVFEDMTRLSREQSSPIHQVWCLGDVVGYGPEPGECVRRIRSRCDICIPGNHDWAAVGRIDLADFSSAAADSALWTRDHLKPDERVYLRSLPEVTQVGDFTLAHGSPSNPIWEYLTSAAAAAPNFSAFNTTYCVVGHSHLPLIFLQPTNAEHVPLAPFNRAMESKVALAMALPGGLSRRAMEEGTNESTSQHFGSCQRIIPSSGHWVLPAGHRAIINPGSVGQPRDGDPRASYVIYDSDLGFEFRRVPYDIGATQRKLRGSGLSDKLAERLAHGV